MLKRGDTNLTSLRNPIDLLSYCRMFSIPVGRNLLSFCKLSKPVIHFKRNTLVNNPTIAQIIRRTMATAMGKRLEGKTIVVTGASSGIGKSTGLSAHTRIPTKSSLMQSSNGIRSDVPQESQADSDRSKD